MGEVREKGRGNEGGLMLRRGRKHVALGGVSARPVIVSLLLGVAASASSVHAANTNLVQQQKIL